MNQRTSILILFLILLFPLVMAQDQLIPDEEDQPPASRTEATEPISLNSLNDQIQRLSFLSRADTLDYVLGPGDLVEISVYGIETFDQLVRISSSGMISIPFVGKIQVAGLTGAELEEDLTKLLTEKRLIKNPQVSVFVREYRSQPVYVMGAVRSPGQYMITQRLNVIDVLAMAGGVNPVNSEDYALLQRRAGLPNPLAEEEEQNGKNLRTDVPEQVRIDLVRLLEEGDMALNIPVQGGDVITVPEREPEFYYVIGEVNRPGAYQMEPDVDILVSQALAWAGGPAKTAKSNDGTLLRYEEGQRKEMAVDFKDIIEGKKSDFQIRKDDVIFIPGSNFKTIGYGLIGGLGGAFARQAAWGTYRVGQAATGAGVDPSN